MRAEAFFAESRGFWKKNIFFVRGRDSPSELRRRCALAICCIEVDSLSPHFLQVRASAAKAFPLSVSAAEQLYHNTEYSRRQIPNRRRVTRLRIELALPRLPSSYVSAVGLTDTTQRCGPRRDTNLYIIIDENQMSRTTRQPQPTHSSSSSRD